MTGLRELPGNSSAYVRAHPLPRLGAQQEVPRGFEASRGLVLRGTECAVKHEPVPESEAPGPRRPDPEECGTAGGAGDLGTPFVRHALLLRLRSPREQQGKPDEREGPAHAVK